MGLTSENEGDTMSVRRDKGQKGMYALFAVVVLGSALGNLSQTAVNAMLGEIMLEFGMDVDLGQWLTTSYMLMLGVTVPVATFLSRRFSVRQHVFIGLAFFLAGAVLDLLASNFGVMLAGRVCQAMSTGMLMPLLQTIAMTGFPPGRQATAMGVAGIAMGFAPNIGPTIGGAMSFAWGWRSYFVLLVVITVALGVVAAMVVKPSAAPDRSAHLDVVSLAFSHARLRRRAAGVFRCEQFFLRQPVHLGAARAGGGVSGAVRAQAKPGGPSAHQHGDILFGAVPRGLRCAELPERVVHGHHAGAAPFTWRTCAAARPWMRALPFCPALWPRLRSTRSPVS